MAEFRIEAFHNPYLPLGARTVHAVVTVTASETNSTQPGGGTDAADDRWELLMVDTSGSMNGKKLRAAKEATNSAVDCIPDGARFGIIAGKHTAELAYPAEPPLAVSSVATRNEAKAIVKTFEASGGTAMGSWIELATELLKEATGIRHAILLTDGKNESEDPWVLDEALAAAEGVFQCDGRGVGADWEVAELRKVATALVGTYDIVADPALLEEDFSAMMLQSLSKQVADVALRVWTPQGAETVSIKQLEPPPPLDLTGGRVDAGPLAGDYITGSWGDESRDYHLEVRVPVGEIDDEMLAARVTLLVGGEPAGQCLVPAIWTDDAAKSTRMNHRVAAALGEQELASAIQDGIDALRSGDDSTATNLLGKAVRLAKDAGNEDALDRLHQVVDEDPVTGRVRPKPKVDRIDLMTLETRSTKASKRAKPQPTHDSAPPGVPSPPEARA